MRLDTEPPRGRLKFQKVSFFSLLIIIQCSLKSSLQKEMWKHHVFQALVIFEIFGYFAPNKKLLLD